MLKQEREVSKQAENEINWMRFEQYLRSNIQGLEDQQMVVKQFTEGYSNLTFLLKIGDWEAVLRRPPFGEIPAKAHDVHREFRLLEKINPVFSIAPKPYLYADDQSIMDKHFYVMEKKTGVVLDDTIPDDYDRAPNTRIRISESVVDTLVDLHNIDYKNIGLENMGKPDGYLERQVHNWIKRYRQFVVGEIEVYPKLEKWLLSNIPIPSSPTIVHNDFKINNMMFSYDEPGEIIGLFDWELCTIGDPLTDLGAAISYWKDENDPFTAINSVTTLGGFISRKQFIERYARKSGRDLSNFNFYLVLAYFKTAVILQQIYYRWKKGHVQDSRFETLDLAIQNLMNAAYESIDSQLV
ncbi:phosphotransferase family protein [Desertibacillus haloalkaliphilus]|uniref:phosphotransferase family protein n=1 Tax=Desertibacillus haloalkaliphilus TaxID=1328930 RepID=UPI001C272DDA|nr:phosphotransferase family protein [Desertibacillus haloalkaliphilus]MBU8906226.1 phosphotransferase family protein [Desertibacillus haloalkaliphilus]